MEMIHPIYLVFNSFHTKGFSGYNYLQGDVSDPEKGVGNKNLRKRTAWTLFEKCPASRLFRFGSLLFR